MPLWLRLWCTYSTSRAIAALQQKTCAVILINAPTAKRYQWPQNVSTCMLVHHACYYKTMCTPLDYIGSCNIIVIARDSSLT